MRTGLPRSSQCSDRSKKPCGNAGTETQIGSDESIVAPIRLISCRSVSNRTQNHDAGVVPRTRECASSFPRPDSPTTAFVGPPLHSVKASQSNRRYRTRTVTRLVAEFRRRVDYTWIGSAPAAAPNSLARNANTSLNTAQPAHASNPNMKHPNSHRHVNSKFIAYSRWNTLPTFHFARLSRVVTGLFALRHSPWPHCVLAESTIES